MDANLEPSVKERLIKLLHDYVEIFALSYEDMPGLDMDIVVHRLPTREDCPLVKQKVHRMRLDMLEKIKVEVMKQFNVDSWLSLPTLNGLPTFFSYVKKTAKYECVWTTEI